MHPGFFEMVRDAFEGFVAGVSGQRHTAVHGRGIKVWFDDSTREHNEAQLIKVDGVVVLEIGFHAEHPKPAMNDAALRHLLVTEPAWRAALGTEPVAGHFIGRAGWQRISETWPVPDDSGDVGTGDDIDVDEVIDTAARLADYVIALEPARRVPRS